MKFRKLGIIEPIAKVIDEKGFDAPTEIQEKSIPLVTQGRDIIAGSATGSGKTLAFAAGILKNTNNTGKIQALVLTPTRELAEQVSRELERFSKYKNLATTTVYGGVSINPQIHKLQKTDIVVGTPGRILDHLERRTLDLRQVKTLVLDEADRMLDMGFIDDVEKIIRSCSRERQTLLFSATIYPEIAGLAKRYMNNPVKVSAEKYVDPSKLKQVYYDIKDNLKFSLLVHLLKHEQQGLVMVFSNTRRNVDFIAKNLKLNGIDSLPIHGGFSQAKRTNVMKHFHSGRAFVLVCTDVAARGLDIPHVSHIYNYDIPKDAKEYVHRIGRTARAGKEGKVINLLAGRDHENFDRVLRENRIKIEKEEIPRIGKAVIKRTERRRQGNRFGSRGFGRKNSRNRNFSRNKGTKNRRDGAWPNIK
ncbi:DEAD/DEAH box helicase [Candidatus Woesearchaeota archaeon]|nr:DEAD/DEAH box helicase [Candidatus Woesearchaeota archaeon]